MNFTFSPIISLVFMVLGNGFFMSFVSLYFKDQGLSEYQIGLTQSAFYLGLLISSLNAEKLISRIGHIRSLTATCGLMSASTLSLYFIPDQFWFAMRFIAGTCVGCFYVGVESWLIAEFPETKRGQALGIYTMALYLAQSFSQLLLPFSDKNASMAFIISSFLVSFAVVPVSVGRRNGPEASVHNPESIFKYFKMSPLGVCGCLLAGMTLSTLYAFMPLYIEKHEFNPGYLMTTMILGGALLQWPIGKLSDYFDRRKVLIGLSSLGAVGFYFLAQIQSEFIFSLFLFIIGGVIFSIYPVAMSLGCDCASEKDLTKIVGVLLFSYGFGAVLGPAMTPLIQLLSENYLIVMLMSYNVILLSIGFFALIIKKPILAEDQSSFTVIPTGPLVEDLHLSSLENDDS